MTLREFLLTDLNREIERSRRALQHVPDNQYEWKPHEKSMLLGYLADMVATIPSWVAAIVTQDSIDIAPVDGPSFKPEPKKTSAALVQALDQSADAARKALEGTSDGHLRTHWQLKARGKVVQDWPRDETIIDTIHHWAHHRGQLTVYLRLMGAQVPWIYGPSADQNPFV